MLEASLTQMDSYVLLGDEHNMIRRWLGGIFPPSIFRTVAILSQIFVYVDFLNVYWCVVSILKIWTWHKHCYLLPPFLRWFQLQVKRFIPEKCQYELYNLYFFIQAVDLQWTTPNSGETACNECS